MFWKRSYNEFKDAREHPTRVRSLFLGYRDQTSLVEFRVLIPKLINLRELTVGWQEWTELPEELSLLAKLRKVAVLNMPVKTFPSFLSSCKRLDELTLRGTDITYIPSDVRLFQKLRRLDLGNNNLISLPCEVSELRRLRKLGLHATRFAASDIERIRSWFPPKTVFYTDGVEIARQIRGRAWR